MDLHLGQKQTQKLILTPQLKQYLRLLELPLFELKQTLENELSANPVLEETEVEPTNDEKNEALLDAVQRTQEYLDDEPSLPDMAQGDPNDVERKHTYQESILSAPPTLTDYLKWQLAFFPLSDEEKEAALEIIGNIDDDGRLVASMDEIAQTTKLPKETVLKALQTIQQMEPAGVAATSLQEALLLQLKKKPEDTSLVQAMLTHHFGLVERRQIDALARVLNVSVDQIKEAFQIITKLEPRPGRVFSQDEPNYVVPEATVSFHPDREEELVIEINDESLPQLRINSMYRRLLKDKKTDEKTKAFLNDKMKSAADTIRALSQRKSTMRLITEELAREQKDFFFKGFAFLKPLRLKDISEKIGLHESTVSRAIQSKFLATPRGTIPYRSFFSTKLESSQDTVGESQRGVMERLKGLIDAENKAKPLSDAKLVQLLEASGLKIARRTVAKYRDILKILPAHQRKN